MSTLPVSPAPEATAPDEASVVHDARLWRDHGWTAQVLKNEDDDGWAVAMYLDGEAEPALVGPWTMGRDKKNPKPLDVNAFNTLVKTAYEVVRRHEQHLAAQLHQQVIVNLPHRRITICLDIEPDDDNPSATLSAQDEDGERLANIKVSPGFKLDRASATAWIEADYPKPR